jgi:hypothetical protein
MSKHFVLFQIKPRASLGGMFSPMYGSSFWFVPLLTHVRLIFLSLNGMYLFSPMYSPSQYAVPCL